MKKMFVLAALFVCCAMWGQDAVRDNYIPRLAPVQASDTTKVLCIGNSFTYFYDTPHHLQEIAAFEGHFLDVTVAVKGGQTFGGHLLYRPTFEALVKGGYDYVFLQDQSQNPARLLSEKNKTVLADFETLVYVVKKSSPEGVCVLERTWSYPGSKNGGFSTEKEFDKYLLKGAKKMASALKVPMSPIGDAFNVVRAEHPEIPMFGPDDKHQSLEGTYLKSCVNYLMIFGKPFGPNPSSCDVDPEIAAILRSVAERVVLK